jgi:hypothetical protein
MARLAAMWRLLQLTVFIAVAFTGIYYEWTPNPLVLGVIAAVCAFGATVLLGDLFRFLSFCRKKLRLLREHRADERLS